MPQAAAPPATIPPPATLPNGALNTPGSNPVPGLIGGPASTGGFQSPSQQSIRIRRWIQVRSPRRFRETRLLVKLHTICEAYSTSSCLTLSSRWSGLLIRRRRVDFVWSIPWSSSKDLGRFVANDILSFRIGPTRPRKIGIPRSPRSVRSRRFNLRMKTVESCPVG